MSICKNCGDKNALGLIAGACAPCAQGLRSMGWAPAGEAERLRAYLIQLRDDNEVEPYLRSWANHALLDKGDLLTPTKDGPTQDRPQL